MNLNHTLRELLWDNPMTLEATRTIRRTLRAGNNNENPTANRNINRFLVGTLGFLYIWTIFGIVQAGEDLSLFVLMAETGLLTLVIPCSLYGAIAVEREKLTYESLIMTRLTPAQIICGKLWWRVGLILSLMALFVPLIVVSHFGAVRHINDFSFPELVWSQVQIFVWSIFLGAFSLWVSARSKKGITSLLSIVAALLTFLALIPSLIGLFGGAINTVDLNDPIRLNMVDTDIPPAIVNFGQRMMVLLLGSNLLYALNPFLMVYSLNPANSGGNNLLTGVEFWQYSGVDYWGVAIYALLTLLFVHGAINTLRNLEMPLREKSVKPGSLLAFGKRGK